MFKNLSDRLNGIFAKLTKRGALSEEDVNAAMREVRIALLEADVALPVVKDFITQVKEKAIGQDVIQSVTPGQMVIKIVHEHLITVLGGDREGGNELNLAAVPPVVIMMTGLQGSGKTTTTAKIAKYLKDKKKKKSLMVSTDIYRPAAREQLETLGKQAGVETLEIIQDEKPLEIVKRAQERARLEGFDVLFIDTAGRLHIDDELMDELVQIRDLTRPTEILLAADAMTGQDAVSVAKTFQEKIGVTGIILSRVDGDARGGAALSMRQITGCPIKFVGVGERIDALEAFHPDRIAGRILDMGDIVSLVEKAAEAIDQDEAEALAQKMQKGVFTLDDMAAQLGQISKMGGMSGLMGMMPGMGKIKDKIGKAGIDDSMVTRQVAIIRSMTKKERRFYKLLNGSRKRRVAEGSGTSVPEVNRLLKQYQDMMLAMKRFNKMGKKGLMRQGIAGLFGPKR
ncbi:MAG: signal recognition particle protein [Alphaproteobacteria bacterium]|nr:signal recognition particle protein [Alphaproteobacteria bacterium]NCQ66724.1 signal recognition particle protein [Alphaproteobacteria bacterium]NCT07175.1 signal recognition particle protein [Alphaproteobacteria bacterium]